MPRRVRIEGYAIVSADGMIADRDRQMPEGLKIDRNQIACFIVIAARIFVGAVAAHWHASSECG
jgi:hypothetical protein